MVCLAFIHIPRDIHVCFFIAQVGIQLLYIYPHIVLAGFLFGAVFHQNLIFTKVIVSFSADVKKLYVRIIIRKIILYPDPYSFTGCCLNSYVCENAFD